MDAWVLLGRRSVCTVWEAKEGQGKRRSAARPSRTCGWSRALNVSRQLCPDSLTSLGVCAYLEVPGRDTASMCCKPNKVRGDLDRRAEREVVLQVLRNDHDEQWSRAVGERAIYLEPPVVDAALAGLRGEGECGSRMAWYGPRMPRVVSTSGFDRCVTGYAWLAFKRDGRSVGYTPRVKPSACVKHPKRSSVWLGGPYRPKDLGMSECGSIVCW
jgi:hypothetical protein